MKTIDANFDVHSSVLFKLGEDLITDAYQALAELIKNSYDADANTARIIIDTKKKYCVEDNEIRAVKGDSQGDLIGSIKIQDDGSGMDVDSIIRGWLTVSASDKGIMKEKGKTTPLHNRTPLGDKGLGRLGAQRLGRYIKLETKKANNVGLSVLIDWDRFRNNQSLSEINIEIRENPEINKQGTVLTIFGLYDLDAWLNQKELQKSFLRIISPYSDSLGFNVKCRVNDESIDLRAISQDVISSSFITYDYSFDGFSLNCDGAFNLRYLDDLRKKKELRYWKELIERDHGEDFYYWLYEKYPEKSKNYCLQYENSTKPFKVQFVIDFNKINGLYCDENGQPLNPGPFSARLDFVNLPYLREKGSALREFMDSIKGVQVYRDGFGIRLKDEIVPFSEQWTSGGSFYTLRPENVIGYINLTAKGNPLLKETTSREEFVKNNVYSNFEVLLAVWLKRTEEVQGFLRRAYKAYIKEKIAKIGENVADAPPEKLASKVKDQLKQLISQQKNDKTPEYETEREQIVEKHDATIDLLVQSAKDEILGNQSSWELISLGIISESVSHEVGNIAQRIIAEARSIEECDVGNSSYAEILVHTEVIRSQASALLKQIIHLDSSLKYMREQRDSILMSEFINEWCVFLRPISEKKSISFTVDVRKDFKVYLNKGRLIQVLDNLALNSIYWLDSSHILGEASKEINIIVDKPILLFYDSGIGVDRSVEFTLFDPFVSRKKDNPRGLGLYVVQNLLESVGATIELSPDRNTFGNRFIFEINLGNLVQG